MCFRRDAQPSKKRAGASTIGKSGRLVIGEHSGNKGCRKGVAGSAPMAAIAQIADIRPSLQLVWQRSFVHPLPMTRKPLVAMSLFAAFSWIGGCGGPAVPGQATLVKADRSRTAFFDRPVALAAARTSSRPYPLIVMLTTDPWLMVVGSDSPTFALYSDGTAIFRTRAGLKTAKLNQTEQADLVHAFDNPDLAALAGGYEVADATDQPDNRLLVYGSKVPFYISVYGSLDDKVVRAKLPRAITEVFDRLRTFHVSDARAWLPDKVEVMAWPYEYAPDQSIIWPQNWPNLNDPTTRKRDDSYSLYLSSSELPALTAFLARRKEKGAVEIDGKKFAMSIRLPFPHEVLWMAPATQ